MIPSVQLLSNSGTLSIIQNELEKFDLPITPRSSPTVSIDGEIQMTTQSNRFNDHYNNEQMMMHHESIGDNFETINMDSVEIPNEVEINDDNDENSICIDNDNVMNYTIIGNGLILNVIDESEVEIDDGTNDSCNVMIREDIEDNFELNTECSQIDDEFIGMNTEIDQHSNSDNNVKRRLINQNESRDLSTTTNKFNSIQRNIDANQNHCENKIDDDDSDDSSSEHELTNLGWLIDLKNITHWPTDTVSSKRRNGSNNSHGTTTNTISNCIIDDIDDDEGTVEPIISDKDLSEERFKKFTIQVKQ